MAKKQTKIIPIKDKIMFMFTSDTSSKTTFRDISSGGILLPGSTDRSAKVPRWGMVLEVGPKVKNVKKGDFILIEPLMWTNHLNIADLKIWFTSEEKVIGISDVAPNSVV